ncbi:MAG: hypothetical protein RIR06_299 [Bacteroidota bacterium]|jgi:PAS domain S-box-containing protein
MGEMTHDEILSAYRELQLRVTRFSSVEQELINTRDALDQELELYKRFQQYVAKALTVHEMDVFLQLVAESCVDVLELETSLVLIEDRKYPVRSKLIAEGFQIGEKEQQISSDIISIAESLKIRNAARMLDSKGLIESSSLSQFSRGVVASYEDESGEFKLYILTLVTKSNEGIYAPISERLVVLFRLLSSQMNSILSIRKRNERIEGQMLKIAMNESELKKLSLIAKRTKSGVIITDTYGKIEWVNDAFTKISGYELDEIKGLKPKDFLQGTESNSEARQVLSESLASKEDVEVTIVNYNKKGEPYYNQLEIISVFDDDGKHANFIAVQKDITQEVLSRQEILRINSRFESIAIHSNIGTWDFDVESRKVVWNDVLYSINGVNKDLPTEQLGQMWRSVIHKDDEAEVYANVGKVESGELEFIEYAYRIVRHNDREVRFLKALIIGEKNEQGKVKRLLGSVRDITESKLAQTNLIAKNEELQKINLELDHFVYSISHDLRAPLLSIKGIMHVLLNKSDLDQQTREFLNLADTSATRLDGTIQEILEYSRNSRLELKTEDVDLLDLFNSSFNDLKFSIEEHVEFKVHIEGEALVKTDRARLSVLVKNIIGNSIKYRSKEREPYIHVNMINSKGWLDVVIRDNGEGIAPEHVAHIFDMFYRATTNSVGTGLGLYICKEIVQKLGGRMHANSILNQGTEMHFSIPLK